jgi:hypothetical protein
MVAPDQLHAYRTAKDILLAGGHLLLHGHYQSGKTTIAHALRKDKELRAAGIVVFVTSLETGIDFTSSAAFYLSLACRIAHRLKCPVPNLEGSASVWFFSLISRWAGTSRLVLILDEFDKLSIAADVLNDVLNAIRGQRQEPLDGRCQIVSIGVLTPSILQKIANTAQVKAQCPAFINPYSPFNSNETVHVGHFNYAQCTTHLTQAAEFLGVELDNAVIASIFVSLVSCVFEMHKLMTDFPGFDART